MRDAQETDAVPVQESWIDQFIQEALHYPRAAIRGSRYRGPDGGDPVHRGAFGYLWQVGQVGP